MKHTRMQRHEEKIRVIAKRNKRIITFTTLVGLVCPATLGTIQALADETVPTSLEQPAEPTVQPTTEPVAEVQPTEAPSQEPVTTEPVETATTEPEQTAPIEQVPEVAPTDSTPVQTQTTDQTTTPVTDVNIVEQAQPRVIPGMEPEHVAKLQENWNKYLGLNQSDYTPESWTTVGFGEPGWTGGYTPTLLADPEIQVPLYSAKTLNLWWDYAFSELVLADTPTPPIVVSSELSGPTEVKAGETHKYSIKLTREDGTVAYEDIEGAAFVLLGLDPSDEIDGEGNITFGNVGTRNFSGQNFTGLTVTVKETTPPVQTGLFYDLVGDTTANVGETKTYKYNEVKFFSDGTKTETLVNIEDTNYPLTSSDPSDVIVGGSITFGSEGARTLVAKDYAGSLLLVAVGIEGQEKTLTGINLVPRIGMILDGKLSPWDDFRIQHYYSDGSREGKISNATDYAFTTGNPNDVITADGIIFNGVGDRVITVTYKGFSAKSNFFVVADQGLNENDLKEAIKNAEEKLEEGGWETTKDLEDAIQKGKDVLADDSRTQEDIDSATKQITDAIDALTKKDDGNNGGNGNNGGTGNGGNNGNNNGGNTGNSNNGAGNSGNQNGNGTGNNSGAGTGSNNQNGNGNKTGTNANNPSTKVVHTNTNTNNSNSNKGNLPQTGEETTLTTALAGFAMAGLSIVAWIKRRRKA